MGSVNKVILVGNLGRDAELRYTPGGAAVATINMATTEVWNDKAGQKQEKTEWHRVVLWGKIGRVAHRVPHQGQADLRRGPAADASVGRQGRQQALHHRDPRRSRRAARRRRARRSRGRRWTAAATAWRGGRRARPNPPSRSPTTIFRSRRQNSGQIADGFQIEARLKRLCSLKSLTQSTLNSLGILQS